MPITVQRIPAATPDEISELAGCCAVFVPGDPARAGRMAFWRPDGAAPPTVAGGTVDDLTVILAGDRGVERTQVTALLLPARAALPVLARARAAAQGHRVTAFWGTAAVVALQLAACGLLLPGLSAADHDAWRAGPLGAADVERVRELGAAMPPEADAVPLEGAEPPRPPGPERLLRAFLDAAADALPRSPAAGGAAYAVREPRQMPEQRAWAAEVAAGHDAGVRISPRVEVPGSASAGPDGSALRLRAVLQVHSVSEPGLVADAAESWASPGAPGRAFGPRAWMDALLVLRRAAARTWPPLTPLLSATVPDAVEPADEEITELLREGARALPLAGVEVHWPKELARKLTTHAAIGPPDEDTGPGEVASATPSFLSADALLGFNWRFALGDQQLTHEELDRLAEANRPAVRLRDQWVLVDPQEVRRAHAQQDRKVTPVDVPEAEDPAGQPAALDATPRDYQLRGLNRLARMTSLGLRCCLADDMGLGKTITLIFPVKSAC